MIDDVAFTNHARERAAQMGVPLLDVLEAIERPEVEYAQPMYGPGHRMHQRGDIAVPIRVCDDGTRLALSVLWRTAETYVRPTTAS